MRIRTLATCLLLTLASAACTGELTDDPGLPDDGDGSGDGSGSGSGSGSNTGTGNFTASVDKPTIATERQTTHTVVVTLQGVDGFKGDVALGASIVDANGTVVPGWTVTLDKSTTPITINGTVVVNAEVKVPSAGARVGTLKIDASSGNLKQTVTSAITAENTITFEVTVNNNVCSYEALNGLRAAPVEVEIGTKVRFLNLSTPTIIIHASNPGNGLPHQGTGAGDQLGQGEAYEINLTQPAGPVADWYCHSINGANVNATAQAQRPALRVVAPS